MPTLMLAMELSNLKRCDFFFRSAAAYSSPVKRKKAGIATAAKFNELVLQEFPNILIEKFRLLHHGHMSAVIKEYDLCMGNVLMKLEGYFGWCNSILKSPDQQSGSIDLI